MRLCTEWFDQADLLACECPNPSDPEVLQRWIDAATEIIYLLSGSQYGGICTSTWRPQVVCTSSPGWRGMAHPTTPVLISGAWYNTGGCACISNGLPVPFAYPRSITQVLIDGAEVDPANYRLDPVGKRIYLTNLAWPHQQDLSKADTEVGTFSVTLTHGLEPPAALVQAAIDYAVELGRGCSGLACRLPARAVSIVKQGVSIDLALAQGILEAGKTGLISVDSALVAYNPYGQRQAPRFYSPDLPLPLG